MLHLSVASSLDADVREICIDPDLLHGEGVVLGRSSGCGVRLVHNHVSRLHARLHLDGGTLFITDLGSTSGTFVGGQPVPSRGRRAVPAEATIAIGPFSIAYRLDAPLGTGTDLGQTMLGAPPIAAIQPVAEVPDGAWKPWQAGERQLTCVRVIEETPDVKTFVFTGEPSLLFHYQPGQFVTLKLHIGGETVHRSYTISSTPSRPHSLSITVKRVPGCDGHAPGLVSHYLHDQLQVGTQIQVAGPFGDFSSHRHPNRRLCLISAGSGITPMLSMTRWHYDTCSNVDIVFVHSARSASDLICRRELEDLASHHPNLRLVFSLSRAQRSDAWSGYTGRLSSELLHSAVPDLDQREVFVCGPAPFMAHIKDELSASGFPMPHYHEESFGGPQAAAVPVQHDDAVARQEHAGDGPGEANPRFGLKAILRGLTGGNQSSGARAAVPAPSSATAAAAQVQFTRSGKSGPSSGTILETAEAQGVKMLCACRMGKCGACKAKLVKGNIHQNGYDDSVLSAADRSNGYILTCIAKAQGDCSIEA